MSEVEKQIEALEDQFLAQLRAGEAPDRRTIVSAHPEIAALLDERLALAELMHREGQEGVPHRTLTPALSQGEREAGDRARRLKCPHCGNHIQLVEPEPREVTCLNCGSSFHVEPGVTADHRHARLPESVGKFEVLEVLGRGAFGTVYKARDRELDRIVAVKMPRAGYFSTQEEEERFLREARHAASLSHPGIVQVYEIGRDGGVPFIVSQYIEGLTLADLLTGNRPSFRESAELAAQVAEALDYAHRRKVIHRDIKPGNILLKSSEGRGPSAEGLKQETRDQGRASEQSSALGISGPLPSALCSPPLCPLITDFGLARRDEGEITVTLDGQVLGTPAYMSPEQAAGEHRKASAKSDIYSLGVVLYELLTGELPFRGNSRMLLHQVLQDDPRPPRRLNDGIPKDLETICLKAMAKEPARRYATAGELADDLRRYLDRMPIRARPVGRAERLWRWCRRNPLVAGLSAAVAVALVVGTAVSTFFAIQANYRAKVAVTEKRRANRKAREADTNAKQAMRRSYISDMRLAQRAWEDGKMQRVRELLDGQRPKRTDGTDLRNFEWYFLNRRCQDELRNFPGKYGMFSPDGKLLAAGDWERVTVRDTGTGEAMFTRSFQFLTMLGFTPDSKRLLGAEWVPAPDLASKLTILDVLSGVKTHDINVSATGMSGRSGLALSPDGTHIAGVFDQFTGTGPNEELIMIWDLASASQTARIKQNGNQVRWLTFSPDGKRLAVGDDETVKLFDADTGEKTLAFVDPAGFGGSGEFSPDGKWLAVASHRWVKLWDTLTGDEGRAFEGHSEDVWRVAFSPDGRRLASATREGAIKVWDVRSGEEILALKAGAGGLAFSPDGRLLASDDSETVKLWDTASDAEAVVLDGRSGARDVAFSPDSRRLASVASEQRLHVWDAANGQELLDLKGLPNTEGLRLAGFGPDGKWLATAQDLQITLWSAESGRRVHGFDGTIPEKLVEEFETHFPIHCLALSADGRMLAAGHGAWVENIPCPIQVWDVSFDGKRASSSRRFILQGHEDWVTRVAFSPDGKRLASFDFQETALVWDMATGKQLFALEGGISSQADLIYSPDGKLLAGGVGDTINVWNATTGRIVRTLKGHNEEVNCLAFSPDGSRLASGSSEGMPRRDVESKKGVVKLWDVASGQETLSFAAHDDGINSLSFSADGLRLATASYDTAKIWDVRPLNDELRREREARSLYYFAVKRLALKEEVIEHFRQTPSVSEPVRELALKWAERYRESAWRLNEAGWETAPRAGQSSAAYELALRQAEAACRLELDNADYLSTLGAAQYRVGQYEKALTTVTRANELHVKEREEPLPWDLKFLAMSQHQLGQKEQAQATLKQLQEMMKQPDWAAYPTTPTFLREAEEVVGLTKP